MRAVVQLVKKAKVEILEDDIRDYSSIKTGFVVLLGISINDSETDIDYITDKIINLRIFKDSEGKLNNDIKSVNGEILVISQFTLYGDARKGRRPSYSDAAKGEQAEILYNRVIEKLKANYIASNIFTGKFGAMMAVHLVNDGPVTIILDSEKKF